MKPKLSIVIPTHATEYNDHFYLKETLVALFHCHGFDENVELIIVENPDKTDRVAEIIQSARPRDDWNIIHTQSELGANRARNHGIKISTADIIALIDDDCTVHAEWIEGILAAHQIYPNVGVIGGSMKLTFNTQKPRWVEGYFTQCLAEVDHGGDVINLSHVHDPYTAMIVSGNLNFKRAIFDKTNGFDEKLGYIGSNCMSQDEIEFIRECSMYGKPNRLYIGSLVVYHNIPPGRLNIDYFKKKSYGDGYNFGRLVNNHEGDDLFIEDAIVSHVFPRWGQHLSPHELSYIRQLIAHEESTRLYIHNLIKCKMEWTRGFEDFFYNINAPSYASQSEKSFLTSALSTNMRRKLI